MAGPQCEDGYTRIANELLEAMCQIHLSGSEWRVLHYIIRKTYGWQKKQDDIPISQIVSGTVLVRRVVLRCLARLKERNIVIRQRSMTMLQKDYKVWASDRIVTSDRTVSDRIVTSDKNVTKTSDNLVPKIVTELSPSKEIKKKKERTLSTEKSKPDILNAIYEFGTRDKTEPWTIPREGGGADLIGDALLAIFCQRLGIGKLPTKKARAWRNALSDTVREWQVTKEQAVKALEALLSDKGDLGWKTYSSPMQKSFASDYGLYIGRVVSGSDLHPKSDWSEVEWLDKVKS